MLFLLAALVSGVLAQELGSRQIDLDFITRYPAIFGLDNLGWSVNVRDGLPEDTMRIPLFEFQFTVNDSMTPPMRTYTYPLDPDTIMRIPDGVDVRTIADSHGINHIYTNASDYINQLKINFGLEIAYSAKAQAASAASGSASQPTLSASGPTSLDNVDLGAFSGSLGVQYVTEKLGSGEYYLLENKLQARLYQMVLGPYVPVREKVARFMEQTVAKWDNGQNPEELYGFIDFYGTHYVEALVAGGQLGMQSMTMRSNTTDRDQLNILAQANFNNMFGLQELSLEFSFEFLEKLSTFDKIAESEFTTCGGDPEVAAFFSGRNDPGQSFQNWLAALPGNPGAVTLRLRNICFLFKVMKYDDTVFDACLDQHTQFMKDA